MLSCDLPKMAEDYSGPSNACISFPEFTISDSECGEGCIIPCSGPMPQKMGGRLNQIQMKRGEKGMNNACKATKCWLAGR